MTLAREQMDDDEEVDQSLRAETAVIYRREENHCIPRLMTKYLPKYETIDD